MRYFIILLLSLFLTSCGVYQVSTTPKVKIAKILTITSTGDTLAVPMKDFQKYNFNTYDFNRFYNNSFYWNSWQHPYFGWGYGWNNWNRPFRPYYHDWYYTPPIYNSPLIRPQIQSPDVRQRVYVNGRRGSSNSNENNSLIDRVIDKLNNRGINVDVIENNDQINRTNIRGYKPSESSNNGRRGWNGENISPQPIIPRQPNSIQPRQIRRGSGSSIPQQTRTSVNTNNQGRNGSGRIQN